MKSLGRGIYTFGEAASLTRLQTRRVRNWFNVHHENRPVFDSEYPTRKLVGFLDLIDVLVAGNLREEGVSLQAIRKVRRRLIETLKTKHPFCHKEIFTDGQEVFLKSAKEEKEDEMVNILTNQQVFPKILKPYLKCVNYDERHKLASQWNIYDGIILDPLRRYGKPLVASCSMPTTILADAYHANGRDLQRVAAWYGVTEDDVAAAINFEANYFGKAA